MILEVKDNIRVFRGIRLQPDLRYVFRLNAQVNIRDAAVCGFRASVEF